jgi:hypothetical protein
VVASTDDFILSVGFAGQPAGGDATKIKVWVPQPLLQAAGIGVPRDTGRSGNRRMRSTRERAATGCSVVEHENNPGDVDEIEVVEVIDLTREDSSD